MTLVDTGENTMTGGRLRRVLHHVADEEAFCFTYGDGVAAKNLLSVFRFERSAMPHALTRPA